MIVYVAVAALVFGYLSLVGSWLALRSLRRFRHATTVLCRDGDSRETLLEAIQRHVDAIEILSGKVDRLRSEVSDAREESAEARNEAALARAELLELNQDVDGMLADTARGLRNVAITRFDATDDMAGRLSFALALLDDNGDGIVLTSTEAGSDRRLCAKGVSDGVGEPELSSVEQRAADAALSRRNARPVEIIPSRLAS